MTFSAYFSNCDEVGAKKHTFHSLDFKQVPERITALYSIKYRLKKHATIQLKCFEFIYINMI